MSRVKWTVHDYWILTAAGLLGWEDTNQGFLALAFWGGFNIIAWIFFWLRGEKT